MSETMQRLRAPSATNTLQCITCVFLGTFYQAYLFFFFNSRHRRTFFGGFLHDRPSTWSVSSRRQRCRWCPTAATKRWCWVNCSFAPWCSASAHCRCCSAARGDAEARRTAGRRQRVENRTRFLRYSLTVKDWQRRGGACASTCCSHTRWFWSFPSTRKLLSCAEMLSQTRV